jgi:hypothetical protein
VNQIGVLVYSVVLTQHVLTITVLSEAVSLDIVMMFHVVVLLFAIKEFVLAALHVLPACVIRVFVQAQLPMLSL